MCKISTAGRDLHNVKSASVRTDDFHLPCVVFAQSDLVVAVGGTKVSSCKHTAKLMKQAPEKFSVRVERLTNVKPQEQEVKFEEDNISVKVRRMLSH